MPYAVKEIYYTLQGEGAQVGRPAVFCRFAGCNLGRVPLVVQLDQPVKQLAPSGRTHGKPHPMRRLPMMMIEHEVAPTVRVTNGMVEVDLA